MSEPELPDFVELKRRYDTELKPGQRADIRRAASPGDLALRPAFYRLLPSGVQPSANLRRVIFLLPSAAHRPGAGNIGRQLASSGKVNQMRIFQMARAKDETTSLQHLRRLCQHVRLAVDWAEFGRTLYYWGAKNRRRIIEDYFTSGGGK
jgi:CRISPR system Cascade subunit CasB